MEEFYVLQVRITVQEKALEFIETFYNGVSSISISKGYLVLSQGTEKGGHYEHIPLDKIVKIKIKKINKVFE